MCIRDRNTDIHYNNPASATQADVTRASVQNNTQNTAQHTGANNSKKVIDLDDGLRDEELNSVPYANDIQYEQMTKALDSENLESETSGPKTVTSKSAAQSGDKAVGNAKSPLPKPKKPPKLPN